jgi:Zn-dependent protease
MVAFQNGFVSIGRWRGAPVRLHWTLPLGALVLGQFKFVPAFWLAFVLLIFIHEMGHAVIVNLCRQRVVAIDIHGMGGLCHWSGAVTPMQRALIAWGGVFAQVALLIATQVALLVLGPPATAFQHGIVSGFVSTNIFLIAINLIPVPPLDGAEAWRLVPLLYRRAANAWSLRRRRHKARAAVERQLHLIEGPANAESRPTSTPSDEDEELTPEVKAMVDDLFERIDPKRRKH